MSAKSLAPLAAVLLLAVSCSERKPVASPDPAKPPTLSAATGLSAPPALTPEEQAAWREDILAALDASDAKAIAEVWDTRGDTEIDPELAERIHEAIKTDFSDKALEVALYLPGIANEEKVRAAMYALAEKDPTAAQNAVLALRSPIEGRRDILAVRLAQRIAADDFAQATAFALHFKDQQVYSGMVTSTVRAGLRAYDVAALPALVEGVMKLAASPEVSNAPETVDPWMMAIAREATSLAASAMDYATLDSLLTLRTGLRDELIGSAVIHRLDETDFDKAQEYALSINDANTRFTALSHLGRFLARDTPGKAVAWVETLPTTDDRSDAYRGMTQTLSFETPEALTTFVRSIPSEENRRLFAKEYADFLDKAELPDAEIWKKALVSP